MLLAAFISWWYGQGWLKQVKLLESRVRNIAGMFSVDILLRTLFSPWKQIVSAARRDQSLGDKFRAGIDNWVSRFVGFGVRILVLFTASLGMAAAAVASTFVILAWPVIPLLPFILLLVSAGVLWP